MGVICQWVSFVTENGFVEVSFFFTKKKTVNVSQKMKGVCNLYRGMCFFYKT